MDLLSIATTANQTAGAFKTVMDMLSGLRSAPQSEHHARLSDLQSAVLAAQQVALDNQAKIALLEQREREANSWAEVERSYRLADIGAGVLGYVPMASDSGPPHALCPACFSQRRKSFLQPTPEWRRGFRVHNCPSCRAEFQFEEYERRFGEEDFEVIL